MRNAISEIPAAPSEIAIGHFSSRLSFETDCWDVWDALRGSDPGFVLVDVRSPELFATGHVPRAVNIPHATIGPEQPNTYTPDTLSEVYCAGPHCNCADKAALRLARLGRPVKEMIGGITGWRDEGFELTSG